MSTVVETPEQKLSDRVRIIGAATGVLILLGWGLYFYPFDNLLDASGTPWGGDYPTFYIAGRMVLESDLTPLYDVAEQQRRLQQLIPGIDPRYCIPYRYPPALGLVMAPLAAVPYVWSSSLFALLSLALIGYAIAILVRATGLAAGRWKATAWWGAATAPIVLEPIIGGQLSPIAVAIAATVAVLLHGGRQAAAGAVLALALYKPNVLALFGLICVLRFPRMLWGAIPVGALWCAANVWLVGVDGMLDYLRLGRELALNDWTIQAPAHKLHGIAAWLSLVAPGHERALTLAIGATAACWVAYRWRRYGDDTTIQWFALSLALTVNALGNPYVPIYDLALLMPAALMMAAGIIAKFGDELHGTLTQSQLLLGSLYFGPHLSQAVAKLYGVQIFPLVLCVIAVWQVRVFMRLHSEPGTFVPGVRTAN